MRRFALSLLLLLSSVLPIKAWATDMPEVLVGKMVVSSGLCLFRGEIFQAFVPRVVAPKGLFTVTQCLYLVENEARNPAYLALIDKEGQEFTKVIKWTDPAIFETVFVRSASSVPAVPRQPVDPPKAPQEVAAPVSTLKVIPGGPVDLAF